MVLGVIVDIIIDIVVDSFVYLEGASGDGASRDTVIVVVGGMILVLGGFGVVGG